MALAGLLYWISNETATHAPRTHKKHTLSKTTPLRTRGEADSSTCFQPLDSPASLVCWHQLPSIFPTIPAHVHNTGPVGP